MQAKQFIDQLEKQGLLDPSLIVEMRRQLNESKGRITCEAVAKLLVENGQLTRFQASRIIADIKKSEDGGNATESRRSAGGGFNDELGFAPDETTGDSPSDEDKVATILGDNEDAIAEVIEVGESTDDGPLEVVVVEDPSEASLARQTRNTLDSGRSTPVKRAKPSQAAPIQRANVRTTLKTNLQTKGPSKNQWDAFRVYGIGLILLLVLIPLAGLGFWLFRGNADKMLGSANEAYEKSHDYEAAANRYQQFNDNFTADPRASMARVRIALSKIRNQSERISDPVAASKKAMELLPSIVNEAGLTSEHRSDVASVLVAIAEKMSLRAESAKTIEEKRALLAKIDEHMGLLQNSLLVGPQEQSQNELKLKQIGEGRERILRDLNRSDDLAAAIAKMTTALDAKKVNDVYALRRELTRKHPQLEINPEVVSLVGRATQLQRDLVGSAAVLPIISREESPSRVFRSVVLANRRVHSPQSGIKGQVYVKVKGSVHALNAADGTILWRRYVGTDWTGPPERLSSEPDSDVLINMPEVGVLQRVAGRDGALIWQVKLGGPITTATVDRDDVLVADATGDLFCLDAANGQTRWAKHIPQSLAVGISVDSIKGNIYLAGDHSNLYVMSRRDGSCSEVFYSGHAAGTIEVPAVYVLGHVFLFENKDLGTCNTRILRTGDDGLGIRVAQKSLTMNGHVVVPPQVEGRRVVVMTDLGQISVLDIEPSSSKDQVSDVAHKVANELKPRIAWPLVDRNEMWVASNGLSRYQIQVSGQKLAREWIKHDQDEFIGRPIRSGSLVIHTRVVRGSQGVRVSAVNGVSGEAVWEVDLGVPVTAMGVDSEGKSVHAVTSQAALYPIGSAPSATPAENPGRNEGELLFRSPVMMANGQIAILNQKLGNKVVLFDPNAASGSRLRMLSLSRRGETPVTDPIAVGSNLLVPLSNGQLVLFDPNNGQNIGSPFQPTLRPGQNLLWLRPTVLSDQQTIVAADNSQKLYRIGSDKQMSTQLEVGLDFAIKGSLASLKDRVFAVSHGHAGDTVYVYNSQDLKNTNRVQLRGNVAWGPHVLGDRAYLYSDNEGLVALDSDGQLLWQSALPRLALVGSPQSVGSDLMVVTSTGTLYRISGDKGVVQSQVEIGEPVSGSPLVLPVGLLVPGDEGVVLLVKTPSATGEGA